MTDRIVPDDVLEAMLRSRAGAGVPDELRASIRGAIAAESPRTARGPGRSHLWRLLAVAAVSVAAIGGAVLIGAGGRSDDPHPTDLAVVPILTPAPTITPTRSVTAVPESPSPVPTDASATPLPGSCSLLQSDARQAGVTSGSWVVGHRGPSKTVENGLILETRSNGSTDLQLLDPATRTTTRVPSFGDGLLGGEWSPTGSAFWFTARQGTGGIGTCSGLFVWSPSGIVEVAYELGLMDGIGWSPTGDGLAYIGPGPESEYTAHLFTTEADGVRRDFGPSCDGCSFADEPLWSPDGRTVAVAWLNEDQSDSGLSFLDVATGEWIEASKPYGDRLSGGRWLDESTLLFQHAVMSPTGPIYVTSTLEKLPSLPWHRVAWPPIDAGSVSPDFDWATNLGCSSCTLDLTSRTTGRTHTVWDSTATAFEWSPTSKQLVVATGDSVPKPGMWIINVDGSGLHRISSTVPTDMAWQPVWR